jgi:hypothetical protein
MVEVFPLQSINKAMTVDESLPDVEIKLPPS